MSNNLVELVKYGSRTIHSKVRDGKRKYVPKNLDECVLYLPMDEKTINLSLDHSGLNHHGTIYGAIEVDGKVNKGLYFDGIDDYVDCGNIADFERTNSFSVMTWIKTSSKGIMICSRSDDIAGWQFYILNNDIAKLFVSMDNNISGGNRITRQGTTQINTGEWFFVAFTYNGSSQNTGIKIYVNDYSEEGSGGTNNLNASIHTDNNCEIGSKKEGQQRNFLGSIDELRIYNRTLSEQEILSAYQQEL